MFRGSHPQKSMQPLSFMIPCLFLTIMHEILSSYPCLSSPSLSQYLTILGIPVTSGSGIDTRSSSFLNKKKKISIGWPWTHSYMDGTGIELLILLPPLLGARTEGMHHGFSSPWLHTNYMRSSTMCFTATPWRRSLWQSPLWTPVFPSVKQLLKITQIIVGANANWGSQWSRTRVCS